MIRDDIWGDFEFDLPQESDSDDEPEWCDRKETSTTSTTSIKKSRFDEDDESEVFFGPVIAEEEETAALNSTFTVDNDEGVTSDYENLSKDKFEQLIGMEALKVAESIYDHVVIMQGKNTIKDTNKREAAKTSSPNMKEHSRKTSTDAHTIRNCHVSDKITNATPIIDLNFDTEVPQLANTPLKDANENYKNATTPVPGLVLTPASPCCSTDGGVQTSTRIVELNIKTSPSHKSGLPSHRSSDKPKKRSKLPTMGCAMKRGNPESVQALHSDFSTKRVPQASSFKLTSQEPRNIPSLAKSRLAIRVPRQAGTTSKRP